METKFAIIGGDLRMIKLAKLLAKEKVIIYTYGLEEAEELKNEKNIKICYTLNEAMEEVETIIGPIPFSADGTNINTKFSKKQIPWQELMGKVQNKKLIAGSIKQEIQKEAKENKIEIIDLMEQEELAILNAISTAEGAIEIAMQNTLKTIHGSNILILGFGRIGKVLAKKLEGLSAKVTCAVRKQEDLAWIKAYGYKGTNINTLKENLAQYDIIINTVPHLILTTENLKYVDKEAVIIDLASKPGGADEQEIKRLGLKFIWGLALPRKSSTSYNSRNHKKYNVPYFRNGKGRRRKNMLIEILKSVLFGIVEGITEWLPISSTGHLILVEQFVKLQNVSEEFWSMFQVVIQFGAILAVVLLYWKQIWPITKNKEKAISKKGILSYFDKNIIILWTKILVACIPAAVIGLLFDEMFEALFYNPFCIATALIIFGIAFIVVENLKPKKTNQNEKETSTQITYKDAIIIGIFQLLAAIFPGTSRSRINHYRRAINRAIQTQCSRIYFLFSHSYHVRSKLIKTS